MPQGVQPAVGHLGSPAKSLHPLSRRVLTKGEHPPGVESCAVLRAAITVPGETLLTFSGLARDFLTRAASVGEGGGNKVKKVSHGTVMAPKFQILWHLDLCLASTWGRARMYYVTPAWHRCTDGELAQLRCCQAEFADRRGIGLDPSTSRPATSAAGRLGRPETRVRSVRPGTTHRCHSSRYTPPRGEHGNRSAGRDVPVLGGVAARQ